ncbi:hypothetical protein M0804_008858 [Polistes exclamans]|nr:hypothetical protein M0804_008858 [Polistes exclamans]
MRDLCGIPVSASPTPGLLSEPGKRIFSWWQLTATLPKIENGMQRVRGWSRNSAGSTIVSQACVHATYIVDSSWNVNDHLLAVVIVTPSRMYNVQTTQQRTSVSSRRKGSDGDSSNRSRPPMAAASFPPNFTNVGVIENCDSSLALGYQSSFTKCRRNHTTNRLQRFVGDHAIVI